MGDARSSGRKHSGVGQLLAGQWLAIDSAQCLIVLLFEPVFANDVALLILAVGAFQQRQAQFQWVDDERFVPNEGESVVMKKVRFRTLGCYPLTGAVESDAEDLQQVIEEMLLSRSSERQGRVIDRDPSASMERKKQEGYF